MQSSNTTFYGLSTKPMLCMHTLSLSVGKEKGKQKGGETKQVKDRIDTENVLSLCATLG